MIFWGWLLCGVALYGSSAENSNNPTNLQLSAGYRQTIRQMILRDGDIENLPSDCFQNFTTAKVGHFSTGWFDGFSPSRCQAIIGINAGILFKGLIMDGCVLLTSTPECVVSPRGETTHEGVDVNNTHPSMINPDYNMILANLTLNYQYFAY